ncbi:hypothetical protein ABO04_01245 [Nitrosomonas sp. HPC101]|nr:hypothetical protein [Nitrosomonas sp. HPC101]
MDGGNYSEIIKDKTFSEITTFFVMIPYPSKCASVSISKNTLEYRQRFQGRLNRLKSRQTQEKQLPDAGHFPLFNPQI